MLKMIQRVKDYVAKWNIARTVSRGDVKIMNSLYDERNLHSDNPEMRRLSARTKFGWYLTYLFNDVRWALSNFKTN